METKNNRYITVAYKLYTGEGEERDIVEEATVEHPFQFISGMGTTLDAFEAQIADLEKGASFDFTLAVDDAYGPYEQERVIELSKDVFKIDGHFDNERIYPGAVVPLMNEDGARFNGTIGEINGDTILVDLNHPLAGKDLNFIGEVVENREATIEEIQGMMNMLSGEGCGCGGCGGGCEDGCGDGDADGGCGCGGCH